MNTAVRENVIHDRQRESSILDHWARGDRRECRGAFAVGAFAVGALAIGRLAIGRLVVRRANFKSVSIGDLTVNRLRVNELTLQNSMEAPR